MENKIEDKKNSFINENHLNELFINAEKIDNNLWENLQKIDKSYEEYSKNCEAIAQRLLIEVIGNDGIKDIHSARYRIKNSNSLLVKTVKKKAQLSLSPSEHYEKEKYRILDYSNYYKIMTDLIGFRILIRYREQWLTVHNWIKKRFYQGDEYYIKNFLEDYNSQPEKPFIAEKPKIYFRNKNDLPFYEQIGKDQFDFIESDEGYNSVHYIINIDGKYIEIQVRTIFDEAWCECTHDLVYKNRNKKIKPELKYLSICLSHQTIASEAIANLMYEKVNSSGTLFGSISKITDLPLLKIENNAIEKSNLTALKKRINKLNQSENNFDGKIKNLI